MKTTINLTEHTKQVDNQTIKFYKEDANGLLVGRKFVKDGVTYIDMFEDFVWQKRGGADKQGCVTIHILELIEDRFDATVFNLNKDNTRGVFKNGSLVCDNRNWSDANGVIFNSFDDVSENDTTKEIMDMTDAENTVSYSPKRYQKKLKAGFTPTYTHYVNTLGAVINASIIASIDAYEGI